MSRLTKELDPTCGVGRKDEGDRVVFIHEYDGCDARRESRCVKRKEGGRLAAAVERGVSDIEGAWGRQVAGMEDGIAPHDDYL